MMHLARASVISRAQTSLRTLHEIFMWNNMHFSIELQCGRVSCKILFAKIRFLFTARLSHLNHRLFSRPGSCWWLGVRKVQAVVRRSRAFACERAKELRFCPCVCVCVCTCLRVCDVHIRTFTLVPGDNAVGLTEPCRRQFWEMEHLGMLNDILFLLGWQFCHALLLYDLQKMYVHPDRIRACRETKTRQ